MKFSDFIFKTNEQYQLPREMEWQLTQKFFIQASTNTRPLMLGATLFAITALMYGSPHFTALGWLGAQYASGLVLHLLVKRYQQPAHSKEELHTYMRARMLVGAIISALFGSSLFLLPAEGHLTGVPTMVFLLTMIAIITVFRYAMLPGYTYLYIGCLVAPQLLFFALHHSPLHLVYLVLIPAGMFMVLHLGKTLSEFSRETISLNTQLKKEIKEHIKTKSALEIIAMQDPLTQLGNRRQFERSLQEELTRYQRFGNSFSVFYIDLDKFKPINDKYGHDVGDHLLMELARRFEAGTRVTDTICRIGGDEFAIIAPGIESADDINSLVAKLQQGITEPVNIDGKPLSIRASIGWSNCPEDGKEKDGLMKVADARMYTEKHATDQVS